MHAQETLLRRCAEEGVRLVYAAERGSRCFGTHDDGSDWDLHAIVANPPRAYAGVAPPPPVWTTSYEGIVSTTLFNVPRAVLMLAKGTIGLYEAAFSACVVHDPDGVGERMRALALAGFGAHTARHQHVNRVELALKAMALKGEGSGRRWLHLIHPLLTADHIDRLGTAPPVGLDALVAAGAPAFLGDAACEALDAKRAGRDVRLSGPDRERLVESGLALRRVLGNDKPRIRPEGMDPAILAMADALSWDLIGIAH